MSYTPTVFAKKGHPDRVARSASKAVALEFEGYKPQTDEAPSAPAVNVPKPPKSQENPKP